MGAKLTPTIPEETAIPIVPWLDAETSALVRAIIISTARRHPDLLAVILYGSMARHDERLLSDPYPSDVDLLFVFDTDDPNSVRKRRIDIFHSIGLAYDGHLDAPRDVQIMLASRTLKEWDPSYIAHVARDGRVLFARGPLPVALTQHPAARVVPLEADGVAQNAQA